MLTSADVLRALIAFLLSGVLGALFQRWLSRAKPRFVITSVGFQGSSKLIKVPEKLVSISDDSVWLNPVMPYASFDELIQQHKEVSEIVQRLTKAKTIANNWLNESESKEKEILSLLEIRQHPYVNDKIVGLAIAKMIRRNNFREVPLNLDYLIKCERIAELSFVDDVGGWHLVLGTKTAVFSAKEISDKNHKDDMMLCAESFSRGSRKNIAYYTRCFVITTNDEILKLSDYRKQLEDILLPEARLFVELSVHNAGQSAVAIRPHMGLKILHPKLEKKPFVLTTRKGVQIEKNSEIQAVTERSVGIDVLPESFLPETSASPYVNIPPNAMQEITLVASESLGKENGEIVKNIYQTGLLKCKIVGQTLAGKAIWSASAIFSNDITADDKANLEKIIRNEAFWNGLKVQ